MQTVVVDSLVHSFFEILSQFFILRIASTLQGLLSHLVVFEHQWRQSLLLVMVSKLKLIFKRRLLQLGVLDRTIEFQIFELVLVFKYQIREKLTLEHRHTRILDVHHALVVVHRLHRLLGLRRVVDVRNEELVESRVHVCAGFET